MIYYKDIPGFEGLYQAGTNGRIFSTRSKKLLKTDCRVNNSGYQSVGLWKKRKEYVKSVHWCVLAAFREQTAEDVNHIDGNKLNNTLANLEWVTRSENNKHAFKLGLHIPYDRTGTKNPNYRHGKQCNKETKNG